MAINVEERTRTQLFCSQIHGFDLIEAPGTQGRGALKKYNCSAAIQKDGDDGRRFLRILGV